MMNRRLARLGARLKLHRIRSPSIYFVLSRCGTGQALTRFFEACMTCSSNGIYDYDAVDSDNVSVRGGHDHRFLPSGETRRRRFAAAGSLALTARRLSRIRRRGNRLAGRQFILPEWHRLFRYCYHKRARDNEGGAEVCSGQLRQRLPRGLSGRLRGLRGEAVPD